MSATISSQELGGTISGAAIGQNVPVTIVLTSGTNRGEIQIVAANRRAMRTAVENGLIDALAEIENKVALKTGTMRRAFRTAVQSVAAAQTNVAGSRIKINGAEIRALHSAIVFYAKYHYFPEGKFGPSYMDPTTKGTFPIKLAQFRDISAFHIRKHLKIALRNERQNTR